MNDLTFFINLLFGKPKNPPIPNLRVGKDDSLFFASLNRGTGISGDQGVGKSSWMSMNLINYALTFPDRPIVVLDAPESLTDDFIEQYHLLPKDQFEAIDSRFVLDRPGDENWVVTKPLFSSEYGLSSEDLVQKATNILEELNIEKLQLTPIMAEAITELAPELFRLISAIQKNGESWQITEAKKLLTNTGLLSMACKEFGQYAPEAKSYFENEYLTSEIKGSERYRQSFALRSALGVIEPKPLRARYGYGKPGITYEEIIEKGLIYFIGGLQLGNQPKAQAWVFWDEYASLRAVINKRTPHDPNNKPVLLVIDEVLQVLKAKGMASAIGQHATYYRARNFPVIIAMQAFWQLDDKLKEQIWNMGNYISFAMENFNDAYEISQQLFEYDPKIVKFQARTDTGQPIAETDRGQYIQAANWIQHLGWRQMVMRRYINEREKEPYVQFIEKTRDKRIGSLPEPLIQIKERLFRRRSIPVKDALQEINSRELTRQVAAKNRPQI